MTIRRKRLHRRMDDGARRWMLKTVRLNHWRVAKWIDLDDLIQDGYMHYQRVLDKYPDVYEPAHLMRLFQRTLTGYLHDLATKRTRELDMLRVVPMPSATSDNADLLVMIGKAPPEVRRLLQRLNEDKAWEELRKPFQRRRGHRETLNERLCRIAEIPPTIDFTRMLRQHFEVV